MNSSIKYKSPLIPILVFSVIAIFFSICWTNPGFDDRLWPYAVIGMLTAFLSLLLGAILIISRIFKLIELNKTYLTTGLLNIGFGVSGLLLLLNNYEEAILLISILPVVIGLYILLDTFAQPRI